MEAEAQRYWSEHRIFDVDEVLHVEQRKIYLNNTMMPEMITRDERVIRQDCLCHLLQDYLPYHEIEL